MSTAAAAPQAPTPQPAVVNQTNEAVALVPVQSRSKAYQLFLANKPALAISGKPFVLVNTTRITVANPPANWADKPSRYVWIREEDSSIDEARSALQMLPKELFSLVWEYQEPNDFFFDLQAPKHPKLNPEADPKRVISPDKSLSNDELTTLLAPIPGMLANCEDEDPRIHVVGHTKLGVMAEGSIGLRGSFFFFGSNALPLRWFNVRYDGGQRTGWKNFTATNAGLGIGISYSADDLCGRVPELSGVKLTLLRSPYEEAQYWKNLPPRMLGAPLHPPRPLPPAGHPTESLQKYMK